MQNLQKELIELLKTNQEFIIEGELNKNKIIEATLKTDKSLLSLLLKSDSFKKHFFEKVDKVLVFDKIKFQRFVSNKSFLSDSYTSFKNKIGLTIDDGSNDNFIKTKNDTVLAWPHKDCVLEGGQTKEDDKRNEIFWNETLAPDNIDRLLDAKVFTNFKRYNKNGANKIDKLKGNENLILKGNNLLVISSLLKTHRGKIKLIYIDPPYNTGGDANIFTYNNTFNHSTWLTFMKNRLSLAKELLTNDGFVTIAIDHYEVGYLNVLADEIFGVENRLGIVTVVHKPEGRNQEKFFGTSNEFMLVYSKNKNSAEFNRVAISEEVLKKFDKKDSAGFYKLNPFINKNHGQKGIDSSTRENRPSFWYPIYVSKDLKHITLEQKKDYYEIFPITDKGIERTWRVKPDSAKERIGKGQLVAQKSSDKIYLFEKYYENQVIKTHWIDKKYNAMTYGTKLLEKIIGRKEFSYPKSLYLIIDILKLMTKKNDIILDFFAGSGTTGHATLELNNQDGGKRKFILVEQLNGHIEVCVERIQKTLTDNSSFVYSELMEYNQFYIYKIQEAKTKDDLLLIWDEMNEKAFLSYQFDKDIFNKRLEAFKTASLEKMQHYLIEVLDKNQLYMNYSEIEDATFKIKDEDKALNYSFYKKNTD